jgi:hypothetical protein
MRPQAASSRRPVPAVNDIAFHTLGTHITAAAVSACEEVDDSFGRARGAFVFSAAQVEPETIRKMIKHCILQ